MSEFTLVHVSSYSFRGSHSQIKISELKKTTLKRSIFPNSLEEERLMKTMYLPMHKQDRKKHAIQTVGESCRQHFTAQRGLSVLHQSTEVVQKGVISAVTLETLVFCAVVKLHRPVIVKIIQFSQETDWRISLEVNIFS